MPSKLPITAVLLFASMLLVFAQTPTPKEKEGEAGQLGTASQSVGEVKRIESLPIPSTVFEIEEELKDAKQMKRQSEEMARFYGDYLERCRSIKRALAAGAGNPKQEISALRNEIDGELRARSFNREKLKSAAAKVKIVAALPENWYETLQTYLDPSDEDVVTLVRNIKLLPTFSESGVEEFRRDYFSDDAVARSDQIPQILQRAADNAQRKLDDAQKSASSNADASGKRYNELSEALRKLQSRTVTTLVEKLPYLIAILAAFGVTAIFLVRLFPETIQVEWVASGQVIQLLTVVTLLLIILCLALANIIFENTIGTLLGGIGGYVLSQGIGRAAGRAAVRAASPPPPDGGASGSTGKQSG